MSFSSQIVGAKTLVLKDEIEMIEVVVMIEMTEVIKDVIEHLMKKIVIEATKGIAIDVQAPDQTQNQDPGPDHVIVPIMQVHDHNYMIETQSKSHQKV